MNRNTPGPYVSTLPTLFRVADNSTQLLLFYYPFTDEKKR